MAETKKDPKIIRVEMEYDDGRLMRLTGNAAVKWLDAANNQASIGSIHGFPFPKIEWEIIKEASSR